MSIIDLPPTLLEAAGLPVPSEMQGQSILPLVRHEPVEWRDELLIQISEVQVGRAIRTKRWKYGVGDKDLDPYKHESSERYVEESLYDLQTDPYELTNLIGFDSHREIADVLRQRLIRSIQTAGEKTPQIDTSPTRQSATRGRYIQPERAWD